ncbi:F0F1 ATP synthase subunit gamma [Psittacicella gerlachiana]|uniref:ATP synthase gamma chain n=1 Tax=Psittacicella gerlachiana TaxID=2028574 RepID=A0A3A1Y581_9GAMM|nr:F0F1 ATP synthase subunit gamma [Psittacicella gerlachiana]RIY33442.1 F0F1 ATP synthase subunit gamma [Psittacicella gerlachiana]
MANTKEIRGKIASIESTQKITSAMEMVATSKMRHAQEAMASSKPYTSALKRVISHIAKAKPNANNPFIKERPVKRALFVVISTDRGLCGGLNINLFKKTLTSLEEYNRQNIKVDIAVIGSKALAFFQNIHCTISYSIVALGDRPSAETTLGFAQGIVEDYLEGKYDVIELFSNKYINTMTQQPRREQYLPLPTLPEDVDHLSSDSNWDYIYDNNDADELLQDLIERYAHNILHTRVLETLACEQAARMIAMKAATDNASKLIDELTLVYNKARQTSITNELNEIVAGAAAV